MFLSRKTLKPQIGLQMVGDLPKPSLKHLLRLLRIVESTTTRHARAGKLRRSSRRRREKRLAPATSRPPRGVEENSKCHMQMVLSCLPGRPFLPPWWLGVVWLDPST